MEHNTKQEITQSYYDFISHIYRYDEDNFVHYEQVEGLVDAMYEIYKGGPNTKQFFLLGCVVDEINKILHNLEMSN